MDHRIDRISSIICAFLLSFVKNSFMHSLIGSRSILPIPHAFSQSVTKPVTQQTDQLASHSVAQLVNLSVRQSLTPSVSQKQSISQLVNQPASNSATQPLVSHSASQSLR